jgi:lysosomal Pro-X carboxypeptidase
MRSSIFAIVLLISLASAVRPLLQTKVEVGAPVPGYTAYNFTTWIDHYGVTFDTFDMRYFVNDQYFDSSAGGPLLFYCGNEGAIEMFITSTG